MRRLIKVVDSNLAPLKGKVEYLPFHMLMSRKNQLLQFLSVLDFLIQYNFYATWHQQANKSPNTTSKFFPSLQMGLKSAYLKSSIFQKMQNVSMQYVNFTFFFENNLLLMKNFDFKKFVTYFVKLSLKF